MLNTLPLLMSIQLFFFQNDHRRSSRNLRQCAWRVAVPVGGIIPLCQREQPKEGRMSVSQKLFHLIIDYQVSRFLNITSR